MLNKPGAFLSLGAIPVVSFVGWLFLLTTLIFGLLWYWERWRRLHEAVEAQRLRDALGQDLVKVIRNQRHGFMNHLQVISGWLQLKKPDHVLEYIDGIRKKREQESQILRIKSLEVLGLLLTKSSLAEANELEVRWEVSGALADPPHVFVEALGQVLELLIMGLSRSGASRPLTVRLSDEAGEYRTELIAEGAQLTASSGIEAATLAKLAAQVRAAGGQWLEELAPSYVLRVAMTRRGGSLRHTRTG